MNHEDSQMMKILETIADRLIDMHLANQRQFAELRSELEARLPAKAGEQLSLLAIVTAPEAVVPNEDEGMPVVADPSWQGPACCPQCDTKADTLTDIADFFGWRKMENGKTIVQSWCRECRSSGKHPTEPVVEPTIVQDEPSPRNKMPAHIKQLSSDATRLANEGNEMIRQASDMIAASTGHVSKEAQRLLNAGREQLNKSADLKSEYGKYQKAAKKASRRK